ncbi:helix-turn-helix transcriptional regulator [Pseudoclavibacter terrae]|uniref:Helix-turn-helix domain-containing protein n=1 Tax=Pseudoclavibacter terrae TaxID=1530195 RepID=A0A7J5B6Z0_9MICO|nr:helix-turn-helix domain-containing protein [Pseudoclavibacter terrae]KAB1639897.1 hypothetical protein F8O03_06210 [Pseudoclavibacter terrae]
MSIDMHPQPTAVTIDPALLANRLISLDELCVYTSTPKNTMYKILARGEGPTRRKIGREYRFRVSKVDAHQLAVTA